MKKYTLIFRTTNYGHIVTLFCKLHLVGNDGYRLKSTEWISMNVMEMVKMFLKSILWGSRNGLFSRILIPLIKIWKRFQLKYLIKYTYLKFILKTCSYVHIVPYNLEAYFVFINFVCINFVLLNMFMTVLKFHLMDLCIITLVLETYLFICIWHIKYYSKANQSAFDHIVNNEI